MTFSISCIIVGAVSDLAAILSKERRLIFPAYFPWDHKKSALAYHASNTYQVLGLYAQIYQDILCDTYPATLLWLLKGHLRVLGMRVKKIGYIPEKSLEENYEELVECVKDHQTCFEFHKLCQNVNS
ncbi:odorant receptor 2a-like [Hermetia illucens]|uniref:odorant receptor 2a-like n=1 Tax=Hermetia illucens TaxID=343691 RepID=UPI0018CBFB64|nr:odorant receptor 2a-like [Hermetia illucens]